MFISCSLVHIKGGVHSWGEIKEDGTGLFGPTSLELITTDKEGERDNVGIISPLDFAKFSGCEMEDVSLRRPVIIVLDSLTSNGDLSGLKPISFPKFRNALSDGRVVQPASSVELRSGNAISFITDSAVRNCYRVFWLKNEFPETRKIWKFGKELGFTTNGEEVGVLSPIQFMEAHKFCRS